MYMFYVYFFLKIELRNNDPYIISIIIFKNYVHFLLPSLMPLRLVVAKLNPIR